MWGIQNPLVLLAYVARRNRKVEILPEHNLRMNLPRQLRIKVQESGQVNIDNTMYDAAGVDESSTGPVSAGMEAGSIATDDVARRGIS